MALKQTRRSVSLSEDTYQRLRIHCESVGVPMSQFVDAAIHGSMNRDNCAAIDDRLKKLIALVRG
jgi:hypothetical protein